MIDIISKDCVVEVEVLYKDLYGGGDLKCMLLNILDTQPTLSETHKFIQSLKEEKKYKVFDIQYIPRKLTVHDNPKLFGATIH